MISLKRWDRSGTNSSYLNLKKSINDRKNWLTNGSALSSRVLDFVNTKIEKHRSQPDRYFVIRYKGGGKLIEESVRRSSQGMNAQKANGMRAEILQNLRESKRPQSLSEKRQIENERKEAEEQKRKLKEKKETTFSEVADGFIKWAKANKKDWVNKQKLS